MTLTHPFSNSATAVKTGTVAVVGLGYVGLPTALSLREAGISVLGVDISSARLDDIRSGDIDFSAAERARVADALASRELKLTAEPSDIAEADAILICVPTPVDEDLQPDLRAVRGACATVVENARRGQTIVLTSTTYVGTTRDMLVQPLERRGFEVGKDVHVAFAPERINPGESAWEQAQVPRVLGGHTDACAAAAARVIAPTAKHLHVVSSTETAELTKLYENTFRAVNLAFANEMAGAAAFYDIDPVEVVDAAATKPYGFLAHYPSAGVGGHCIPVDPYYLLSPLRAADVEAPVIEHAMKAIDERSAVIADRAVEVLDERGVPADKRRVLMVGVAYKPSVQDSRESPAVKIASQLAARGVEVSYHDPLIESARIPGIGELESVAMPAPADTDLALIACVHPGFSYRWLEQFDDVLDATYRTPGGRVRHGL
jgi:nucleotide sugar dehydrogenase